MNTAENNAKWVVIGLVLAVALGSALGAQANPLRTADVSTSVQPSSRDQVLLAALLRTSPADATGFHASMDLGNLRVVDFPSVIEDNRIAFGMAAFMRFSLTDQVFIDLDVSGHRILEGGQDSMVTSTITCTQVKVGFLVNPHLAVFAGPQLGLTVFEVGARDQMSQISGPRGPGGQGTLEAGSGFMVGLQVF